MKKFDKLVIQRYVQKGDRIIPVSANRRPVAIAMQNFEEGDIGKVDFNISFPVIYNNRLLDLPGLKKISEYEERRKKRGTTSRKN